MEESISTLKFADRAKQVMMYVRQAEKPPVDAYLVERLQREGVQLRAMILKLKDAQMAAESMKRNKQDQERVEALTERVQELEAQLQNEKSEVRSFASRAKILSLSPFTKRVIKERY